MVGRRSSCSSTATGSFWSATPIARPRPGMLPGGGVRRGEAFRAAAVREADEELGLSLRDLTLLLSYTVHREHKHDELTVFRAEIPREADLIIDRAELAEARWWPLDGLPGSLDEDDRGVLEERQGLLLSVTAVSVAGGLSESWEPLSSAHSDAAAGGLGAQPIVEGGQRVGRRVLDGE
ncbi:MAG: NUDIX hydrolase [Solirubrobacteraceae bacterium]